MVYVKYCIHVKQKIPLDLPTTNWTLKHVSVKGQIAVKTCQSGNLTYIKFQDIEEEVCMRQQRDNNDDNSRKNEDLKGKGGGRLIHYNVDGDVSLCHRKTEEKAKTTAAAIKRTTKKNQSGSSTLNSMKDGGET